MPSRFVWDVYRDQLQVTARGIGHALWEPDPHGRRPVEVGDVGFVRSGQFQRLFNIHLDAGDEDQSPELPAHFEPLPLDETDIMRVTLCKGPYYSSSVRALNVEVQASECASISDTCLALTT